MRKLFLFTIVALTVLSTAGLTLQARAQSLTSSAGVTFVGESTYASQACTIENGVVAVKDAPSVRVRFSNAEGDWICSVDNQLDLKSYGALDSLAIEVVPEG